MSNPKFLFSLAMCKLSHQCASCHVVQIKRLMHASYKVVLHTDTAARDAESVESAGGGAAHHAQQEDHSPGP